MSVVAETTELSEVEKELADQPRERRKLIEQFVARLLQRALEQSRERESLDDLRQWTELSEAFAALGTRANGNLLAQAIDALDAVQDEIDDGQAREERGRLRVLSMYEEARAGVHTVGWLEEQGISRQRLNQWRTAGRLIGIRGLPGVRGFAYPRWQFDDSLQPRGFVSTIATVAEDARIDPLALHFLMTEPVPGYDRTPVQLIDAGELDLVVRFVRAANTQGT